MTKHTGQLTPAAACIRMSSDRQEASPDQQRAEVAKLAEMHGYRIIREYFDDGISGDSTEKRKAFQQMIRDAGEKRDFDVILCWSQDRFGRFDSVEAGHWIFLLRQSGVRLHTVVEGLIDWNDFTGRMMYSIVQEGKHQFLRDLSGNVLRGKIAAAKQGRGAAAPPWGMDRAFYDPTGNLVKRVPFGERFSKPKDWTMRFVLAQDAEAVETVRWIFDTFANNDCGMGWIVGELNRRGVKSPRGVTWSVQTVVRTLKKRVYCGANVFGTHHSGKYHHLGANGESAAGRSATRDGDPIVVEGVHEVLIDPETFQRCHEKLAERSTKKQRPRRSSYLLSGVLRCGHCGAPMYGRSCRYSGRGSGVWRYYTCSKGTSRPGVCLQYQVRQKQVEDYVLGAVEACLLADQAVDEIAAEIRQQAKGGQKRTGGQTKALKGQIETLDRKIAKGNENLLLAAADHVADLSTLLGEWKAERIRLQEKLEGVAASSDGQTAEQRAARAVAELKRLREHFRTRDPMKVRAVVHSLVDDVRLWWEPSQPKRPKRLARGVLTFRNDPQVFSPPSRTWSR